ncbi:MAG TPA: GFA family protein [Alphaproteobacteria bacterium]|nr:GFA family protein [Alphaproteobacteria bacterium]
MSDSTETRAGGCHCGKLRYVAHGAPLWVAHCHCRSCQRTSGAPFVTYAGYLEDRFAFTGGSSASFASSPGVIRRFCADCGTPVIYQSTRWPGEVHICVCTFDAPATLAPGAHVFVAQSQPWLRLADGLPRFAKTSKEGGPLP